MTYSIIQLVDISDGMPGMLIPIFSSNGTNLPYVQEMDEFFQVDSLVPFLEYENYPLLTSDSSESINVGDQGLIAFRSTDSEIVCQRVTEILEYIEANREKISKSAVLLFQLQRIEAASLSTSYDAWGEVARNIFKSEAQQRLWINSEMALFQKQTQIWSEISSKRAEKDEKRNGLPGPVARFSTEYLIRWLNMRDNFAYRDWAKIWHYVNESNPFDLRLLDVAQKWLIASQADGGDLGEARTILFSVFHHARFAKFDFAELGRLLSDRFDEKPYTVFYFLRPIILFANLFWFLSLYGETEEVLDLVMFCADELPVEPYIRAALLAALATLQTRSDMTFADQQFCEKLKYDLENSSS